MIAGGSPVSEGALWRDRGTSRVGAWRSPVAHLHGGQVVAGSNPVAPTNLDLPPPHRAIGSLRDRIAAARGLPSRKSPDSLALAGE